MKSYFILLSMFLSFSSFAKDLRLCRTGSLKARLQGSYTFDDIEKSGLIKTYELNSKSFIAHTTERTRQMRLDTCLIHNFRFITTRDLNNQKMIKNYFFSVTQPYAASVLELSSEEVERFLQGSKTLYDVDDLISNNSNWQTWYHNFY